MSATDMMSKSALVRRFEFVRKAALLLVDVCLQLLLYELLVLQV